MGALLGLLLMLLSGLALLRLLGSFRRAWREAEILRLPALPQQDFRLDAVGDLRLCLQGPRYRTWGKRLAYTLSDVVSSKRIDVVPSYSGTGVRSRSHSRVVHARFRSLAPASLRLQIAGLEPQDESLYQVVLMRPFTDRLLAYILGFVLLGMLLVGSLVLVVLSLAI